MLIEAYVLLFVSRMGVLTQPLKTVLRLSSTETLRKPKDPSGSERAAHWTVWAVTTASRYGLWNCKCLTQALTAKFMLKRRGYPSTLVLGATPPAQGAMKAHAWLLFGGEVITGSEGMEVFTEVARFR